MKEIWKDVVGYEGIYKISSFGIVASVKRLRKNHHNSNAIVNGKIIKQEINERGYCRVRLCKNRVYRHFFVHRLVAEAFLLNPKNKDYVNHKDFNRANNRVENLEWVSAKENSMYSSQHSSMARLSISCPHSKEHYIYTRKSNGKRYFVEFCRRNFYYYKSFETLDEAIKARDKIIEKLGEIK